MAAKRIITVFGATGAQGGSVADIFVHDPKLSRDWQVRGVTRDATKDSAKKLASKGVEVVAVSLLFSSSPTARRFVHASCQRTLLAFAEYLHAPQADLNDKASLVRAMENSAAVFALTNYWDKMDRDLEVQQGRNLADAAKASKAPGPEMPSARGR